MTKFKDIISDKLFNKPLQFPSVAVSNSTHKLTIRFDSKDRVVDSGYEGPFNIWLSALCASMANKLLSELLNYSFENIKDFFKDDEFFWEVLQEDSEKFIDPSFELFHTSLDSYRGRDYLYKESSPLVCRCFGIREDDILEHLNKTEVPTLDTLAGVSKAGMGCRSCVPQLKRWLVLNEAKKQNHFYKDKPAAEWLLEIDYMLSCFPKSLEWKMEVTGMKQNQVSISFDKAVTQREEEETAKELQDFLGRALDTGLAFFLRRARHFSKAKG